MTHVVASAHRHAPFDHGLLNAVEPLRLLQLSTRPLHFMIRRRPVRRRNLITLQEWCSRRADSFLHSRVSQLKWPAA